MDHVTELTDREVLYSHMGPPCWLTSGIFVRSVSIDERNFLIILQKSGTIEALHAESRRSSANNAHQLRRRMAGCCSTLPSTFAVL